MFLFGNVILHHLSLYPNRAQPSKNIKMSTQNNRSDYEIIASEFGVQVNAVKQAWKRREKYPNSALLLAIKKLQEAKSKAAKVAKMKAIKKAA